MRKNSYFYLLFLLFIDIYAENRFDTELLSFSLEDLTQLQVSSVANRYESDSPKSASAVTVITEEEIKRHGYKTLEELLQNVVGFDKAYHVFRSLVSSRGFRQDINSNYLLLVDGHRVNESAYSGFGNAHIFPMMDTIKRVEVIRGASSTLWGGSALNGIISITTKKGSDYADGNRSGGVVEGSMDYEFENRRSIFNATYAKSSEEYDITLSALYFDNDAEITGLYGYGTTANIPFYDAQAIYHYKPSYQIYTKARYGDFQLNVHYSDYENQDNIETSSKKNSKGYLDYHSNWIELLYMPKITDTISLEARFFYDDKKKEYHREPLDGSPAFKSRKYQDRGYGTEIILHQNGDDYHMLAGLFAQFQRLSVFEKDKFSPGANIDQILDDKVYAGFTEINYRGVESWIFTLGARYEYSDTRGDRNSFLPRAMVYRQISDNSYIKYMLNTGSLRPTLITTRGFVYEENGNRYYAKGADRSQESLSHSIQFGYSSDDLYFTALFFYDTIKDLILWGGKAYSGEVNGVPSQLWETNLADITQKGIELEAKWHPEGEISYYATYSYADTSYDHEWLKYDERKLFSLIGSEYTDSSLKMAGASEQNWNFGFDWDVTPNLAWNFNYHGRYGVLSIYPNPDWKKFGFEHFFDINIRYINPFSTRTEIDLYVKNITDNRGRFPTGYGEVETQLGRQVGLKIKMIR